MALLSLEKVLIDVRSEVIRAEQIHGPFNSLHEGYAVILEELDELWDEVKKKGHIRDEELIREEAIQVAAMAIRFITNLIDKD